MGSGLYLCLCHPAFQCKLSTLACQNKYFPSPWFLLRQEVNPHSAVVHSCRLSMHTVLANTDSSSQEKLTPGWIHYSDTFLSSASISSLPNSNLSLPSAHLGFSSLYIPVVHSTLLYLQVQAGFADPNWFLPFSISGKFHCAAWGARAGTAVKECSKSLPSGPSSPSPSRFAMSAGHGLVGESLQCHSWKARDTNWRCDDAQDTSSLCKISTPISSVTSSLRGHSSHCCVILHREICVLVHNLPWAVEVCGNNTLSHIIIFVMRSQR